MAVKEWSKRIECDTEQEMWEQAKKLLGCECERDYNNENVYLGSNGGKIIDFGEHLMVRGVDDNKKFVYLKTRFTFEEFKQMIAKEKRELEACDAIIFACHENDGADFAKTVERFVNAKRNSIVKKLEEMGI